MLREILRAPDWVPYECMHARTHAFPLHTAATRNARCLAADLLTCRCAAEASARPATSRPKRRCCESDSRPHCHSESSAACSAAASSVCAAMARSAAGNWASTKDAYMAPPCSAFFNSCKSLTRRSAFILHSRPLQGGLKWVAVSRGELRVGENGARWRLRCLSAHHRYNYQVTVVPENIKCIPADIFWTEVIIAVGMRLWRSICCKLLRHPSVLIDRCATRQRSCQIMSTASYIR